MEKPLVINQSDLVHIIPIHNILFCQADRSYCTVHLANGEKITYTRSLANLGKQLGNYFIRISQSVIVNKNHICKIDKKCRMICLLNNTHLKYTINNTLLINQLSPPLMALEKNLAHK
jgi:DNA-binding LytR/AlgR family response regulator